MSQSSDASASAASRTDDSPLILVVGESHRGHLEDVTFELLGDARRAAESMQGRVELVVTTGAAGTADVLASLGKYLEPGERVHLLEADALESPTPDDMLEVLGPLAAELAPHLVMVGATANGRAVAPRLATRLEIGCVPHCLSIKVSRGKLTLTRISYSGRAHQQSTWPQQRPLVITMKPGVADLPAGRSEPIEPSFRRIQPPVTQGRVRILEHIPPDPKTQDLTESERIVAGGRGVGGPEGFRTIEDFADAVHASVGASRVAVDRGWIEHPRQVGQTGKTVIPELYVACGISGASHHLAGMRGSETIVAVNTDKQAPIFQVAHFGTVGDLHEVLPRAAEHIRAQKG